MPTVAGERVCCAIVNRPRFIGRPQPDGIGRRVALSPATPEVIPGLRAFGGYDVGPCSWPLQTTGNNPSMSGFIESHW